MKKEVCLLSSMLLLGIGNYAHSVTTVYAYNKTGLPASLDVTAHYYQKKTASASAYGGYIYKRVDSTERSTLPITSSRTMIAESAWIDRLTVHTATIMTQSGPVVVDINQTFTLEKGYEEYATNARCGIITINADLTCTVAPETEQCG